jgi:hypothetical protein
MVNHPILDAVIRQLELYFLRENDCRLTGESYDLILFVEAGWSGNREYNLLLSARLLDNRSQRDVIHALLTDFRNIPAYQEFHLISGLTILKSNSPLVRDSKRAFSFRTSFNKPVVEVAGYELELGDELSKGGLFVRSTLLEQLKENAIVELQFSSDGGISNQLRTIQVGYLNRDMMLYGTIIHSSTGQPPYSTGRNTFSIPLAQVQRIRPEADFSSHSTF